MFNIQMAITPKVGKQELQFMCSACRLIVLYICVKFHENILDGISYRVDMNDGSTNGQTDGHSKLWRIQPNTFATFCSRA